MPAAWAIASSWSTPGITGFPGKCPWKYCSLSVTFLIAVSSSSPRVSNGTFASYNQGGTISLTPTVQSITTTQTTYILYIWLDGTMDNPTSVLDQDYHFELYATGDGELAG